MSQPSAVQSRTPQHFLRDSKISAPQADLLHGAHARHVAELASSPAGWHGSDDIETLVGLAGDFLWSENPFALARISFVFDAGHLGSQGSYQIINGLLTVEKGAFYSVPNNPAIGWAAISLAPTGASELRSFGVAGMFTDANWTIETLMLQKLGPSGPLLPPFSAVRLA